MIAFVWNPSFGNFRFGSFALELALRKFGLETLACLGTFFLGTPLGDLASEKCVWELSLGNFGFGSLAWNLWLGIFGLSSCAWGSGILRMGEPLGGSQGNPARRGATTGLQHVE